MLFVLLEIRWLTIGYPIDLIQGEFLIVGMSVLTGFDAINTDVSCLIMIDVIDDGNRAFQRAFLKEPSARNEETIARC